MPIDLTSQSILWAALFSGFVLVVFWVEYRRVRARLGHREEQIRQRMYEISILRELQERIGYSLNVQKIVDIISSSLGKLLPYSTVAYMLKGNEGKLVFHMILAEQVNKSFLADVKKRMTLSFSALFNKTYQEKDIEESISGVVTDPENKKAVQSFFNIPIVINNKPTGILTVASTEPGLYKTSSEVEILYTIMNQASEAVSKLETVLEIEKGKLNAMVASMADGVIMIDKDFHLMVANPMARKMLELKEAEPSVFDILDGLSDHIDLRTKIEESIKKDTLVVEPEVRVRDRFLQILITPVKDNNNKALGSVILLHDMTREKELEKLREDFTSMMVHELRSPLTGIRSIAGLLKGDKIKQDQTKYQEFIGLIESNSNSMLDLVNDLLDVAKLESGKFEVFKRPADLKLLIKGRIDSFSSLASESKLTLEQKIMPEIPQTLVFDDAKITQVLNNLLSNAIKFTPAGGKIAVSSFMCEKGADLPQQAANLGLPWQGLKHGAVCPVGSVVVSVSDTGYGISENEIGKLWSKFKQLSSSSKSEKKGTGLGLVIVKGVVEAHGGQAGVFSEEGKGTTFYFTLPV